MEEEKKKWTEKVDQERRTSLKSAQVEQALMITAANP